MIKFTYKGDYKKTDQYLHRLNNIQFTSILTRFAQLGVESLSRSTPINSGKTASSWGYKIVNNKSGFEIIWTNSNIEDGAPIAILIQYGHVTRNGGYVEGYDYINPAIQPIIDEISNFVRKEMAKD